MKIVLVICAVVATLSLATLAGTMLAEQSRQSRYATIDLIGMRGHFALENTLSLNGEVLAQDAQFLKVKTYKKDQIVFVRRDSIVQFYISQ